MDLAPQEVVDYKARDGLELQGILVRPLGEARGRVPLVLDVHGGPESHVRNGWVTGYSLPGQVLAAKGIAVFLPNYRGSTGRGVEFSKLGQGDPAGKEFDDLVDAVDHFVAPGLADGSKVGVTGGSYGGYATAWCSTRYSDRFAAGVMFVGISDKISKTGTTDIPDEEYPGPRPPPPLGRLAGPPGTQPDLPRREGEDPAADPPRQGRPSGLPGPVAGTLPLPQGPRAGPRPAGPLPRRRPRQPPGGLPAGLQPPDGRMADPLPPGERRDHAADGPGLRIRPEIIDGRSVEPEASPTIRATFGLVGLASGSTQASSQLSDGIAMPSGSRARRSADLRRAVPRHRAVSQSDFKELGGGISFVEIADDRASRRPFPGAGRMPSQDRDAERAISARSASRSSLILGACSRSRSLVGSRSKSRAALGKNRRGPTGRLAWPSRRPPDHSGLFLADRDDPLGSSPSHFATLGFDPGFAERPWIDSRTQARSVRPRVRPRPRGSLPCSEKSAGKASRQRPCLRMADRA